MIRGTKGDLVKLLILMKLIILDICLSIKPNHWIINPIHQVIMDSWKRLLLMRSPSGRLIQIFRADFLFEYVIMELGLIGNKYKQQNLKNQSYFNEIKRMGAGPHPSAPHVTKEL